MARTEPLQWERTAELYGLLSAQPYYATSRLFHDMSGRYLQEYVNSLPQEQARAARERGKNKEIWASSAELLNFLKGEWGIG
jgi:hypothetical protein